MRGFGVLVLLGILMFGVGSWGRRERTWHSRQGTAMPGRMTQVFARTEAGESAVAIRSAERGRMVVATEQLSAQDRIQVNVFRGMLYAAMAAGAIASLVGGLWLLISAFGVSVLWGLCVLLLPGAQLVFTIIRWDEARRPFLTSLAGFVLVFGAIWAGGGAG